MKKLLNVFKDTIDQANSVNKKEEVILFVSFDLVNSTKFKSYNYLNWFDVIYVITESIRKKIQAIDENFQLWRSIGDEVIFTIVVSKTEKIESITQEVFKVLNEIYLSIKNGDIFPRSKFEERDICGLIEQNILSIKATSWIALVSSDAECNEFKYNLKYEYPVADNIRVIEFQGNDIDTGFRIAKKCTNPRRLTLSLELAYILAKSKFIKSKLHIISYCRLKGIWESRLYPVIWYHDEYIAGSTMEKSFFYDEIDEQPLVKDYMIKYKNKRSEEDIELSLEKILINTNLKFKVNKILDRINESNHNASGKALNTQTSSDYIEMHCVAVCINNDNKVLIGKRKSTCEDFPNLWDFGCCQIKTGLTFEKALKKSYKECFNIDIEIDKPFRDYSFERGNIVVPGIRYKAKVVNDTMMKATGIYESCKFVSLEEFDRLNSEDVLDYKEFREIISEVTKIK